MITIDAPHFCCGVVVVDGVVIDSAPIVKYMKGWVVPKVIDYCTRKGWEVL